VQRERRAADLPSRVADNLFWIGRHAERAEQMVRVLRSFVSYLTREDSADERHEIAAVHRVLVDLGLVPPETNADMRLDEWQRALAVLFRPDARPSGLRATLVEVRRLATAVRDWLSPDTWRIISQLELDFRLRHGRVQFDDVLMHLNRMVRDLAAFSGMEMENMTRGHGWRFLDIGRRLERAVDATRVIRSALGSPAPPHAVLEPLLEIADSAMTYRRRYFAEPQLAPVLDLLVADDANPRAIAFQLKALAAHLEHLPRDPRAPSPTQEQRLTAHALEVVSAADANALGGEHADGGFSALLETIDADMRSLSDALTFYYFSHAQLRVSR
jgi:uncharacterized alpha-E superfamily protein